AGGWETSKHACMLFFAASARSTPGVCARRVPPMCAPGVRSGQGISGPSAVPPDRHVHRDEACFRQGGRLHLDDEESHVAVAVPDADLGARRRGGQRVVAGLLPRGQRSEEHTSELQSRENLVCRLLLEKKKT